MERYQFKVTNLDCAMCAKEIEESLSKQKWVESASLNFNTEKLVVVTERTDDILPDVVKYAKAVEPDCNIEPFEQQRGATEKNKKLDWYIPCFIVGFALGLTGVLLDYLSSLQTLAYVFMWVGAALLLTKTLKNAVLKLVRSHSVDENLLVGISVIGALAINEGMEGLMVIVLYQIGKFFESKAVDKTRNSVKSLIMVKPETVPVKVENGYVNTPLEDVEIGAVILVKAGEIVPLDGVIASGNCSLNLSSLTGESVPVSVKENDEVLSGSVVLDGVLEVRTTSLDRDSTITKILNLIETASERKAKSETIVTRVTKYYVPAVVVCAAVVALCFGLFSDVGVKASLYKGMIFLVVSCPCAVAISVPLSYFCGIGNASSRGILVKGTNFLDNAVNIKVLALDKTGTITTGNFAVKSVDVLDASYCEDEIMTFAYFAERTSTHPIARAIVQYVGERAEQINLEPVQPENVKETAGKGVSYVLDGDLITVGKGDGESAYTAVAVKINGVKIAEIYLGDTVKNGVAEALGYLKSNGVKTEMLTGDNLTVAKAVADEVGVDGFKASLMPEDKFNEMERLIAEKKKPTDMVAYAGDGINDAPVLSRADIGIAMGLSGSAATVDTADIVLMNDDLSQLTDLHKLSKKTRIIVGENVYATLAVKLTFVILGLCSVTGLAWAVFADVGLTICTVLNSLRVLNYNPKGKIK